MSLCSRIVSAIQGFRGRIDEQAETIAGQAETIAGLEGTIAGQAKTIEDLTEDRDAFQVAFEKLEADLTAIGEAAGLEMDGGETDTDGEAEDGDDATDEA